MASVAQLGLVEGEALELTSGDSDVLPLQAARLVGSYAREPRTRGGGARALHADLGTLPYFLFAGLHLQRPRSFLRSKFGQQL